MQPQQKQSNLPQRIEPLYQQVQRADHHHGDLSFFDRDLCFGQQTDRRDQALVRADDQPASRAANPECRHAGPQGKPGQPSRAAPYAVPPVGGSHTIARIPAHSLPPSRILS